MRRALLFALFTAVLAGCDRPQKTADQLRAEIAAYKETPTDAAQAKIEGDFARLQAQIEKLQAKGDAVEAAAYRTTAENLRSDYRAARMVSAMKNAQSAIQGLGNAFKEAGQSIGETFRDSPTPPPK